MEYMTDTLLCKALFIAALVAGFGVGLIVGKLQ